MSEAITKHLDLWTSALLAKSGAGRGGSSKQEAYGINKLRALILELAIRGKLVPQDKKEEPASVLLKEIKKNKKAGAIKKEKPLPPVSDAEKQFDLPTGWEWARFDDLVLHSEAGWSPNCESTPRTGKGWGVLKVSAVTWGEYDPSENKALPANLEPRLECEVKPGDFLISRANTAELVARAVVVPENTPRHLMLSDKIIRLVFSSECNHRFLSLVNSSDFARQYYAKVAGGTSSSMKNVSRKQILNLVVALPPIAEQRRIVAKVDELMALCDQLEQQQTHSLEAHQTLVETLLGTLTSAASPQELNEAWALIASHFDDLFITRNSVEQLRQSILKLAIKGSLVKQNPKFEPADVLLKNCAKKKAQMIEEGRLRREKACPNLKVEAHPFELPSGWVWTHLPEVGELARGKSKHRPRNDPKLYLGGTIPLVQTGDVSKANPWISSCTAMYNNVGLNQSRLWPKGTLCITIAANIAETGLLKSEACFPDSVVGFIPFDEELDIRYFEYFLRTAKRRLEDFAPSTAQKNINLDILGQLLVPLPPREEVKRIVAKVDELMALCDALSARLAEAQATQTHLADAIVEQAVA